MFQNVRVEVVIEWDRRERLGEASSWNGEGWVFICVCRPSGSFCDRKFTEEKCGQDHFVGWSRRKHKKRSRAELGAVFTCCVQGPELHPQGRGRKRLYSLI